VIDDPLEDSMERLNAELLQKTGVALVVVTVPALVEETIDAFAVRVGERWGVGRRGDGMGIVIAVAKQNRWVFIATGYGVEQYLPEGRVGQLVDEYARPSFRSENFGHGLYLLSVALAGASAREFGSRLAEMPPIESRVQEHGRRLDVGLLLTCLAVVLALRYPALFFRLLVGSRGRGWQGSGFGSAFGGGLGGHGADRDSDL
jgi:uncharacterized protein